MAKLKEKELERSRKLSKVDDKTKHTIEYIMFIIEACSSKQIWSAQRTELEESLILKDAKALKKVIKEIL